MTKNETSKKQKKFIEILLNCDYEEDSDIYSQIGINEETFYKWLKDEGFKKYMEDAVSAHIIGENPKVVKSLIDQCKKGNSTALKIYFDLKNKEKSETEKIYVTILDDVPNEKN